MPKKLLHIRLENVFFVLLFMKWLRKYITLNLDRSSLYLLRTVLFESLGHLRLINKVIEEI